MLVREEKWGRGPRREGVGKDWCAGQQMPLEEDVWCELKMGRPDKHFKVTV